MENNPEKQQSESRNPFMMKGGMYRWIIVALIIMLGLQFIFSWGQQGKTISYTSFKEKVKAGAIEKVEIDQSTILAYTKKNEDKETATGPDYNIIIPTSISDAKLMEMLVGIIMF